MVDSPSIKRQVTGNMDNERHSFHAAPVHFSLALEQGVGSPCSITPGPADAEVRHVGIIYEHTCTRIWGDMNTCLPGPELGPIKTYFM